MLYSRAVMATEEEIEPDIDDDDEENTAVNTAVSELNKKEV